MSGTTERIAVYHGGGLASLPDVGRIHFTANRKLAAAVAGLRKGKVLETAIEVDARTGEAVTPNWYRWTGGEYVYYSGTEEEIERRLEALGIEGTAAYEGVELLGAEREARARLEASNGLRGSRGGPDVWDFERMLAAFLRMYLLKGGKQ